MTSSLVGSEMCIRDRMSEDHVEIRRRPVFVGVVTGIPEQCEAQLLPCTCLLYTSDAADDM
eukprot:6116680-Prorocentrum_lima.AAC.1